MSAPYILFVEDDRGDVVDYKAYHEHCAPDNAGAWPGGMETDYDVHCDKCGELLWHGLHTEDEKQAMLSEVAEAIRRQNDS